MFSWKRAVLHALIPFALALVAGIMFVMVGTVSDPEQFGEGVGKFSFVLACAGFGVSWLAQTGRKKAARVVVGAIVALVGALVIAIATASAPHHATAADRAPLVEENGRLTHPTLGFSITRPPMTYMPAPQLGAMMGKQGPDTALYAYSNEHGGLIVSVLFDMGGSRFDDALEGLRRGIDNGARQGGQKVEWIQNTVSGDDAHREAHLHAKIATGAHMKIAAYELPDAFVALVSIATDGPTLDDIIASFRRP